MTDAAGAPLRASPEEECHLPLHVVKPSTRLGDFVLSVVSMEHLVGFVRSNSQFERREAEGRECNFKEAHYLSGNQDSIVIDL